MTIYLDHHATTPCDQEVIEAMLPYFNQKFGNAHAKNQTGRDAMAAFSAGKAKVAALINANPEDMILTSGATESNNIALLGAARAAKDRREILIGALEHPSVSRTAAALADQGMIVKTIPSTKDGFITVDAVRNMISDKTLLVSVMSANNEIGTIQPFAEIGKVAQDAGALFHCDATQGAGKFLIDVKTQNIDLLSFSAHKIYGPQGIGALYMRSRPPVSVVPVMFGSNQQPLRSGTVPIALTVGFGEACARAQQLMQSDRERLEKLTLLFLEKLRDGVADLRINGSMQNRLAGSLNIRMGIPSEDVLLDLAQDLSLSTGGACGSGSGKPSSVLTAIGLEVHETAQSLRISLGRHTTRDDVLTAAAKLIECATSVRKRKSHA